MPRVRPPVVAGVFYPADPAALLSEVRGLLEAVPPPTDATPPRALVVPHAGLRFSGAVAATAYARLAGGGGTVRTVILLGPAHFAPVAGISASSAQAFASPLGEVAVDEAAGARALELPCVRVADAVHAPEHCLEVQLPFLQAVLPGARIVPLLAGQHAQPAVEELLGALWQEDDTLVVLTSDLSHHLSYEEAQARDAATAAAIEALDPAGILPDATCGRAPLQALLAVAQARGLGARTLDLRSSGDTGGRRGRVVGYGAFAFEAV